MNRIFTFFIALISTTLVGYLNCSSLLAQATDQETSITDSSAQNTKQSVDAALHLRPAYHAQFAGKPMGFDDGSFRFDHVMIDFAGQVVPKLSYKYLQRLNKVSPIFSKENLPSSIDYAYLKYSFNEQFYMIAGKQALSIGGFEYYKYPVEVYDYSGIINSVTCYLTGAQIAYAPTKSQELTFQVLNNRMGTWEEAVGRPQAGLQIEAPNMPLYYSLGWNSNYFNNALQLRYAVNYTSPAKNKTLFMVSGGQKFQSGPFSIYIDAFYQRSEIDYLGEIRKLTADPINIVEYVDYLSVLGEVNYRFHSKWNILLKCFYNDFSTYKSSGYLDKGSCLTSLNYQAGIEYYPLEDDNLHFFFTSTFKQYSESKMAQITTPADELRLSVGLVYRVPVLSLKR